MTVKERIESILDSQVDMDNDSVEKLIYLAFCFGEERATRHVSNLYNKLLAERHARADACRYHNMANEIVGKKHYIYTSNYSGEMTSIFGNDPTSI